MRAGDEELLRGTAVDSEPALTAFVAMLRESAEAPGPRPTDALANVLRTGRVPRAVTARAPIPVAAPTAVPLAARLRRLTSRAAALGLAAKIALTAGVAVASVGTVAAVGGVPAGVQERAAETLGHIVAVFTPGHDADKVSPAAPGQSPSAAAVLPGASPRPTQRPSPTDLPTSAGSGRELPEPATSNRAPAAGTAGSGEATAPGSSSSAANDAPAADRATGPHFGGSGNDAWRPSPAPSDEPTPSPTRAPSAEPTRAANHG